MNYYCLNFQATSKRPLPQHFHDLRRSQKKLASSSFVQNGLLTTQTVTIGQSQWEGHDVLVLTYDLALGGNVQERVPFAQPSIAAFEDRVDDGHGGSYFGSPFQN